MNNKGQIIITDLLLYIIILIVILSLITFTIVTLNDNQVTRINNKQLNSILEDNMNTLTKTSGTPSNWEKTNLKNLKTIGLKSENNHLISYEKLMKLKNNNQLLNDYFPSGVSYELTLYPKNNPDNKMLISGNPLSNKKQILSKSEVILLDYGFQTTSFNKDNNNESCYYNHNSSWSCKAFTISKTLLNEGKYYIITNSKTEYVLSNTFSENITEESEGITKINKQLEQLLKTENETIHIHIKNNKNHTYITYDNNNNEEFLKQVIKPETYILNMKIAIWGRIKWKTIKY